MSIGANWSTPETLKAQLGRRWERGELLREMLAEDTLFPLRLRLRGPTPAELTSHFEVARTWAGALANLGYVRTEWREVRHRVHGLQRLPSQIYVDTLDDALGWLGRRCEADRFTAVCEATRQHCPALLPWLARRPLQALELAPQWPVLLEVVRWCMGHPRPGVYLRQIDAPGVHTKFIEAYRSVLAELLDLALPPSVIDDDARGAVQFAARYGFLGKPVRIRFRLLDEHIPLLTGPALPDITLDADSFAALKVAVRQVFITENETNFLAFPSVPGSLVLFGAGYGWEALARARWLDRCALYYWGDIDTHGFAILDRLRGHFAHAQSWLMDRETLMAHRPHWGEETDPTRQDLRHLTVEEQAIYDDLRDNRIVPRLRLEQERIGFQWLRRALLHHPPGIGYSPPRNPPMGLTGKEA